MNPKHQELQATPCGTLQSEASAVIAAMETYCQPTVLKVAPLQELEAYDAPAIAVVPKGQQVIDLAPFYEAARETPKRASGRANVDDLTSFIALTNRHKTPATALFYATSPLGLQAVVDYHHDEPGWQKHRVVYRCPTSAEWQKWNALNGRWLSQTDFASALEDGILDVLPPECAAGSAKDYAAKLGVELAHPQRLLEVSRGLQVSVKQKVHNAVTLQSGETQVAFVSTHEDAAGQPLKVPAAFLLGLPVFRNGDLFTVPARLRYRVREGAVEWRIELHRADRCAEIAIQEAAQQAATGTELPLFYGIPEGGW